LSSRKFGLEVALILASFTVSRRTRTWPGAGAARVSCGVLRGGVVRVRRARCCGARFKGHSSGSTTIPTDTVKWQT
jgi:hypothetical protein